MASPLASVVPVPMVWTVEPMVLVGIENVTAWPPTAVPESSVTLAVSMVNSPASREVESAFRVMRLPVAIAVLVIIIDLVNVPELAWTVSWRGRVGNKFPAV